MKIAIAGFGAEGRANLAYYQAQGGHDITILDEKPLVDTPPDCVVKTGDTVFADLKKYDFVVRTAGLSLEKLTSAQKVWSGTNEFFARCPAPIVGVTGTKGKGTTATMIADILKASGRNVWLVGNIGKPALEVLALIKPDDIVVFELSSFQLWDIERSPHIAVVLLIEPDHLNVHTSMDQYTQAKRNIVRYQSADDYCIYNMDNEVSASFAQNIQSKTIGFGRKGQNSVYVQDEFFMIGDTRLFPTSTLQVIGVHNQQNACAAIAAARTLNVSNEDIRQGLADFKGLPHRLEFVRTYNGVDYYNDSFSSAPAASVAAVRSFDRPLVVILGGVNKGGDYSQLVEILAEKKNIRSIMLIGESKESLGQLCIDAGLGDKIMKIDVRTMREIVAIARSAAHTGDIVLLSPGCASFDMFMDFYDRGNQFRDEVRKLS